MSQLALFYDNEDQLKLLIKECLREVLSEKIPYPSPGIANTKLYTRDDVAIELKVSANTVSRYIRQGKLHASVFNGMYRISETELLKFITKSGK